jgi:DNA-binding transcriptional LysR family regulator
MNVGQPAVSKSVAQLRARLGVPLSVSLDSWPASHRGRAAGSTERAEAATAEDAEVQAQVASRRLSGTLRVCAAVTLTRLHIVPAIATFLGGHPELQGGTTATEGVRAAVRLWNPESGGSTDTG